MLFWGISVKAKVLLKITMAIEVEVRTFITSEKYRELFHLFQSQGVLLNEDYQETYYFNCPQDLRIQKNSFYAKICLKKGNIHDAIQEEIEIQVSLEDFNKLQSLFAALNYQIKVKWFRKRYTFTWQGIKVMLDDTKGYGQILELEKVVENETVSPEELETIRQSLEVKLTELHVPLTPKEVFNQHFHYYLSHWRELVGE